MLKDTEDQEEIIARVAALDIGKANSSLVSAFPVTPRRVDGCRKSVPTPR
ncbi:hypothetical protein [Actinoplanes sp. NPDC026623]